MQGFIDSGVVYKPGEIPMFYERLKSRSIVPDVKQTLPGCYTYPFVQGRHAETGEAERIISTCDEFVWHDTGYHIQQHVVKAYVDYVWNVAKTCDVAHHKVVPQALMIIEKAKHEFVLNVHGDLTLENVIITPDNRVVFIDPGLPRGMYTPALDRGKLLQSIIMRWEERLWEHPNRVPDWATKMDIAFLVTHWVRLIPHWPYLETKRGFVALETLHATRLSSTSME